MARGTGFTLTPDDPRTFPEWIRQRARIGGDRRALDICGVKRTYLELDDRTDRAAAGFASLGLEPGEHVSLMMQNSIENIEAWFGLQKAGLVEVPVHTASRGNALRYIVDHADARAIVIDEAFLPNFREVANDLPQLQHVVVNRNEPAAEGADATLPPRLAVHDLAGLYLDGPPPTLRQQRTDTAVILHSSGTTGPPKGVVLSHDAVIHLTRHLVWLMDYTSEDVLYTSFPLFHNNAKYTSVCAALECGGSLVMDKRFPVSTFWDVTREKGITAFNYMGALLMMLHKQEPRPDDADNPVRIGFGAPCPVEIWEEFEARFGMKLVEVYGMTEAPMICENRLDDRRIGSAGRESMAYQVLIVDEQDEPCPPNVPGEIVARPKRAGALFSGYYKRPEDTEEAWRNLWFHTGDRGRMDEDGFVFFLDRMKDCIRRRGENISSWEVESTINGNPAVLESAAFGVASELSESEVMVAVVRRPGEELGPAELLDYCTGKMAHFAIPRYVRFMDALPRNHAERVQKVDLRAEGVTPDTWDREAHGYKNPAMSSTVRIERGVMVEMRDGVRLATDVYLPEGDGPFPTLLTRIRGGRGSGFIVGVLLLNPLASVERGYAVAVQEVRGRAGSDDAWHPFVHEAEDCADCLDWLLAQPFCDGRVGTYGTAYSASTALYTTALGRDEVKACAVLGTGADLHDGWVYTSGAFELGWNVYWAYMTLSESISRLDVDEDTRAGLKREYAAALREAPGVAARLPISDHPLLERCGDLQFREWLEHPDYDDYWRAIDVLAEPEKLRAPMLTIVGWYDNFLSSHFDLYNALSPHAPHRLVCGPWEHTSYVSPFSTSRVGAVELGPDAISGVGLSTPLCLDWFDRWLEGEERGAAGGVRYWQLGDNEWREAERWPPPHVEERWHLRSGGRANSSFGDGVLDMGAPGSEPADSFVYDPLDPVPTVGGKTLMPTIMTAGIEDQSEIELRDDVLVYTSAAVAAPVVVQGRVRVELWAASSAPDTDFTAKLVDLAPDGFAANLADGIVRARYRDSSRRRSEPLRPGEPTLFTIDLWDLAHTFLPGHRIRLELSSSNFPRFDRNTNTGNEIGVDGPDDVALAAQQIFHDAERASALVLPVADG